MIQTGSGVHVDVTDKEGNSGDYYWGKSAALDSLLNKYLFLPLPFFGDTVRILVLMTGDFKDNVFFLLLKCLIQH